MRAKSKRVLWGGYLDKSRGGGIGKEENPGGGGSRRRGDPGKGVKAKRTPRRVAFRTEIRILGIS